MKLNLILDSYLNESLTYKYMAFDMDDNILTLPTKVKMLKNDKPILISSEEFATKRLLIGKKDAEGNSWSLPEDAFNDFRPAGDAKFLEDIKNPTKYGPVWKDFVECINNARIFSIITARGHTPSVFKTAIKGMILRNQNGLNKVLCVKNINDWRQKANLKPLQENEALEYYLGELCKFYPVSYPGMFGGTETNPSLAKTKAMDAFASHVKTEAAKAGYKKGKKIAMGFSDDDKKNFDLMADHMKKAKHGFSSVHLKNTGEKPEKIVLGSKKKL